VAGVVGRSPAAVRQLASRARRHVEEGKPRFPAGPEEEMRLAGAFAAAWQEGAMEALLVLLDPEVELRADGGGRVPTAGKPLHGADRVARMLLGLGRAAAKAGRESKGRFAYVNGKPGLVVDDGLSMSVVSLTFDRGRIAAIHIMRNPEKLRHVEPPA
jgi:RNA polymerase sigma-70 factor (ECF subfamily)